MLARKLASKVSLGTTKLTWTDLIFLITYLMMYTLRRRYMYRVSLNPGISIIRTLSSPIYAGMFGYTVADS